MPCTGQLCHWAVPALTIKPLQEVLIHSFQIAICNCEQLGKACMWTKPLAACLSAGSMAHSIAKWLACVCKAMRQPAQYQHQQYTKS